ncbi:MAG TPA: nicotinate phosphoribosyltransferase [Oculatellaceae cyanobacterium]
MINEISEFTRSELSSSESGLPDGMPYTSAPLFDPIYYIDFYKVGHIDQYPKGITQIWSNWTPRTTRVPEQKTVVHFGLQYFLKRVLIELFGNFFALPVSVAVEQYEHVIRATLGISKPRTDHIRELHGLGYLPVAFYSVPEGTSVPLNCPAVVVTNTHPSFFWLPNYLETMLSAYLWKPSTSATTAQRFRSVFERFAKQSGETDMSFVDWQGHDFSMRGMSGLEDSILSGLGHLTCFRGTDTVPAILAAQHYYGASLDCGGSVPATEHSVMCAGGQDGEFETFRRLIEDIYPSGIVSIVSDTWDLWKVLSDYIPRLSSVVKSRSGKVVIRPDSGVPDLIICGDPESTDELARKGTLVLLAEALGTAANGSGLPIINGAGAIYGDSISYERAERILDRIVNELKLSPFNMVFGIGSYTYEYVTRDTYGYAMKATAVRREGKVIPIFKKPVTDGGGKFSHKGIPAVYGESGAYTYKEGSNPEDLDNCAFVKVFENGRLLVDESFDVIRSRVRENL